MRVALEILEGVGPFARDEVAAVLPRARIEAVDATELRIRLDDRGAVADGDPRGEPTSEAAADLLSPLLGLRTVVAAHLLLDFPVRRPRGLLSPDNWARLLAAVTLARRVARPGRFASFRLNAAGSDSGELLRLRREIARHSGLVDDPDEGDLLLRLRRAPATGAGTTTRGWQVLVRLTPRPLSARPWRVANYPGALNATLAAAVVAATRPAPTDRFIDLMCGSGTLVIERLAAGPAAHLSACDLAPEALEAARTNQRAAKFKGRVDYVQADARDLGAHLPAGRDAPGFNRLVVNLPWGELVGEHAANDLLYPAVLVEAARLATEDGVFCVLTQDISRFDRALDRSTGWTVDRTWRLFAKGHRPCLYRLVHS